MLKLRTFDEVSATDYFAIINQDCNRNEMQKLGGPPLPREEKKRNFKEYLRERTKILDISIVDLQRKVDEISTKMFSANLKRQLQELKCRIVRCIVFYVEA